MKASFLRCTTQMTKLINQVTDCGRFIQSYAEDTNFCIHCYLGDRPLVLFSGMQLYSRSITDKKGPIDRYCNTLKAL